jgi:hypothetical protein
MIDALVVGGGFYGVSVANYLVEKRGMKEVRLIEHKASLMSRASYNNQARIHNGYHYPRSFVTAYRSRINLPQFVADFPLAIKSDFTKLYAIARHNTKVTARQFVRFCSEIGASLEPVPEQYRPFFDPNFIEAVFLVEEYAFDAAKLNIWGMDSLRSADIEVNFNTHAGSCHAIQNGIRVHLDFENGKKEQVDSRFVFNCTYSGLNHLGGEQTPTTTQLKHEITEMGLMRMPSSLEKLGITVMDGPFFSVMPFPSRQLHSLSHVRYTPHMSWTDKPDIDPYQRLSSYHKESRVNRMLRDSSRYIPALADASQQDSLFEVKTVLCKNENDDGRPILFEKSTSLPGLYSILGGKIDNIYDIINFLDQETFSH